MMQPNLTRPRRAPSAQRRPALRDKLDILSGAAKYDASCASSGSTRRGAASGATHPSGVCHSWSADGRCISLLKVLYSNACLYDCAYCVNRRSNDHPRASFSPVELARLTVDFYRRNYIEGLFLSSAVFSSPDATMEQLLETLRQLRQVHAFHGYIHLKVIPGCSPELLARAAALADRLSANIELPSSRSLRLLAPEKKEEQIIGVFSDVDRLARNGPVARPRGGRQPITPVGMSTQMIIGATPETDLDILKRADLLYRGPGLKRVYYSAYIPVNRDRRLPVPAGAPPLLREHRLYQADWLLRFYQFDVDEILDPAAPRLDPRLDPKAAWALRHPEHFPVDVNRAGKRELLRIPGVGVRSAGRIVFARRRARLRVEDLARLGVVMKRARYFLHDGRCRPAAVPPGQDALLRALISGTAGHSPPQLSFDFSCPTETAGGALDGVPR